VSDKGEERDLMLGVAEDLRSPGQVDEALQGFAIEGRTSCP
jgi:hypothetical protein